MKNTELQCMDFLYFIRRPEYILFVEISLSGRNKLKCSFINTTPGNTFQGEINLKYAIAVQQFLMSIWLESEMDGRTYGWMDGWLDGGVESGWAGYQLCFSFHLQ